MASLVLHVFTQRQGLAARLGHDLRLSTRATRITLSDGRLEARVDLRALEVDGAMRREQLDTTALSASDRESIACAMREVVLETGRHPEAVFVGSAGVNGDRVRATGVLVLRGRSHPFNMDLTRTAQRVVGQTTLQPSLWGIRPYAALGGALKVRDQVEVRAELTLDADTLWPTTSL